MSNDMSNEFEMARKRLALEKITFGKITNEKLKEKIKERLAFLQIIIDFVSDVCLQIGTTIKYEQGSCNTHVVREIENFAGFYIYWSIGETQWGGDTIEITSKENNEKILHLRYCGGKLLEANDVWEIKMYDERLLREKFLKIIDDKNKILDEMKEQKLRSELETKKREKIRKEKEKLIEDAKKLGL